ncbi:MAG: hypothetical protein ACUVXF_12040 [Desulfobaccales bacterium]
MKIEDLLFLPVNPASSPTPKAGQDKFADLLQEALAVQQPLGGSQALGGPALITGTEQRGTAKAAQEMVEVVLSRLEIFQEALSRPGLSLKSLSPLVQALEQDSQHLTSLAQDLPDDSPLRRLAEETAALTWTEGCKFKRGDYL